MSGCPDDDVHAKKPAEVLGASIGLTLANGLTGAGRVRLTKIFTHSFLTLTWLFACQAEDSGDGGAPSGTSDGTGAAPQGTTGGTSGTHPLERELEENFRSPVVSGPYLWSANPETNRVARIDARTFEVDVFDGGHGPTFVAALPDEDGPNGAVVINVHSDDASIFRSGGAPGEPGRVDVTQERLPIQQGASDWEVGASGRFAIAWSRFEQDLRGPLDGYQDLTVLSLGVEPPTATRVSVGFRPTQVVMSRDETRVFVVSDPGLSVIDLTTDPPSIASELLLPDSLEGSNRDVSFTPDGELAFVRFNRSREVLIVRIRDNTRVIVELPEEVTDLDLSEDGTLAIAVMRGKILAPPARPVEMSEDGGAGGVGGVPNTPLPDNSRIALLSVPAIFENPGDYALVGTQELVGSVVIARDASSALFYTSAIDNTRVLILDLNSLEQTAIDLQAPVQAAFLSEDGRYAAAVMTPPPGSTSSGAFALLITGGNLPPRITGTSTVPRFISVTQDRALVTTWGSQARPAAAFLGKFPQLAIDQLELRSEPLASGMVPDAKQAFVAQAHPEGRVTFIDWQTSAPTEVTGFELSSRVVEE